MSIEVGITHVDATGLSGSVVVVGKEVNYETKRNYLIHHLLLDNGRDA